MRPILLSLFLCSSLSAQPYRGLIGGEVEGLTEGSRARGFVDLGRGFRPWSPVTDGGAAVPVDENGWPKSDAQTVLFDVRAVPAWNPPIDDPAQFQPDWSGTYALSFNGKAVIGVSGFVVEDQAYDAASNLTTAKLIVPPGSGLVVIIFNRTQRTESSPINSGITNLRVIRPDYPKDSVQPFTREYLRSLRPFSVLRFMGFANTNDAPASAGNQTYWKDRHVVTDATQQNAGEKVGIAWEYAILTANMTGKDMWVNIPVAADDDYVLSFARLLRATLRPDLNVYVEYSNEVWNPGFPQNAWNNNAAAAEARAGGSKLNNDGTIDSAKWARRRHAQRLMQIGNIFTSVFGAGAINTRIRPVYAWWTIFPAQYDDVLEWMNTAWGPPSSFFYAMAQTHYFNDEAVHGNAGATVDDVLAALRRNSDQGLGTQSALAAVAAKWNLKHVIYEGGPDTGGGNTTAIGNRILSQRDPRMRDVLIHDIKENWFDKGGDLYMYFTVTSAYSRWGTWGAAEDSALLDTVKYQTVRELIGAPPAPRISGGGVVDSAGGSAIAAPGGFLTLYGSDFAARSVTWTYAIPAWSRALPLMLEGVMVRANGQDCSISYVSPNQINALLPPDLPPGPVTVEVENEGGKATATVTLARTAPAFFTYLLNGGTQIAALHAGTAIYVAPEGALPGVASRAAGAGDYLELYGSGLGPTATAIPSAQVLSKPYPLADPSKVSVTIGGLAASIQGVNMTYPGLFQVNIRVPDGVPAGDQAVILSLDGQSTQPAARLSFRQSAQ